MTASGTGAVFFLGTRAHYQVLQQPESRFGSENGNASTETIYQNNSVDNSDAFGQRNFAYIDSEANVIEDKEMANGVKRSRKESKSRQSEETLCDKDAEMKPAMLNHSGECSETPKTKLSKRRVKLINFLASLYKRKKRLHTDQIQNVETEQQACTYRECCRCLECQSRYFEVQYDSSDDYSSDDNGYGTDYAAYYTPAVPTPQPNEDEDEDDEVFLDTLPPGDSTSTDLLMETQETPRQMSVSSDDGSKTDIHAEVAVGTSVLLNHLMYHPIACIIQ